MNASFLSSPSLTDGEGADQDDIERIWIDAARQNPSAFEPLYLRYRLRIYHYLRMRLAHDEDAADLTHQVFLRALTALPRYQHRGIPFAVWLFRIAQHSALTFGSRQRPVVSWEALSENLHPGSEHSPEDWAIQQEKLEWLQRTLQGIDTQKRELLALRFAAGLTVPQIASVVGKKPEAVKKQLQRLLYTFQEHYHHEHP